MAHVHVDGIRSMVKIGVIEGVSIDNREQFIRFKARAHRKITHVKIPQQGEDRERKVLDLVQPDVCGTFPETSIDVFRYFITLVDDH